MITASIIALIMYTVSTSETSVSQETAIFILNSTDDYCLHYRPDCGGSKHLRNVAQFLPVCSVQQPSRLSTSKNQVFGLCPSSNVLSKHYVSETESVSVFRRSEGRPDSVGSVRKSDFNVTGHCSCRPANIEFSFKGVFK
jgi:hypothetical protein